MARVKNPSWFQTGAKSVYEGDHLICLSDKAENSAKRLMIYNHLLFYSCKLPHAILGYKQPIWEQTFTNMLCSKERLSEFPTCF